MRSIYFVGASTALLGKEGAMACTVAVEESITDHYNGESSTTKEELFDISHASDFVSKTQNHIAPTEV